jgi:beta-glucosidase
MKKGTFTPTYTAWPKVESLIKRDLKIEQEVARIVKAMTLEEKVGQMIQPNLREVTPDEAKEYKLGSILNGGGAWPYENKHALAKDWVEQADSFWFALKSAFTDRPFSIPFMWATDAVHGHNNVFGATIFPHNIGLGCARDPALIGRIGRITAIEIAVTGLDWTFAPTVTVPRDKRWGRVYEGYSEHPEVVSAYAAEMVRGLQGSAEELQDDYHVIANVKHWIGDGGTELGADRGINYCSEDELRDIHAAGYFSGLNSGAQVVMSSFNSWSNSCNYDHSPDLPSEYNGKIHGSKYLITDVLKKRMGFDGFVITDWHGHAEVSKCSDHDASYAINAGNDILMIPAREHWQSVYHKTIEYVRCGRISLDRINDAVTRILRVKMRAGLWTKPAPSLRALAGKQVYLGCHTHRDTAREAVRKSLVLLKNKASILPLSVNQSIILTGSAADNLQKQSGGWSLTWQGDENNIDDFPHFMTVKSALESVLGSDNVDYDPQLTGPLKAGDTAIVVFGEDPYAEMMGDIKAWQTLEYAAIKRSYRADLEIIRRLHDAGVNIISLFFSGRPLYVNEEIAKSNAFVAAFLPGSEGLGITDLLFKNQNGKYNHDFTGTLSFSWPLLKTAYCQGDSLFSYGYGLNYSDRQQEGNLDCLPLDDTCGFEVNSIEPTHHLYGIHAITGDYQLKMIANNTSVIVVSRNNPVCLESVTTTPYNYQQQQDAIKLSTHGQSIAIYIQPTDGVANDFQRYKQHNGAIVFDIKIEAASAKPVYFALNSMVGDDRNQWTTQLDITARLPPISDCFSTVKIACADLIDSRLVFTSIHTPFCLYIPDNFELVLANIRWECE